ncbi:uncharacterized protein TNCV_632521 [Trichonephila clavipes]|nr:uncharacterized protein TNCV_632521 [Trichonephila clavipes]
MKAFRFQRTNCTGYAYLHALQLWLFPQLKGSESSNFIWQQDDALPHRHLADCVYIPLQPADLPDLRHRIEAAVARITSDTPNKVWNELAYRLDVYIVTNGAHMEHL